MAVKKHGSDYFLIVNPTRLYGIDTGVYRCWDKKIVPHWFIRIPRSHKHYYDRDGAVRSKFWALRRWSN